MVWWDSEPENEVVYDDVICSSLEFPSRRAVWHAIYGLNASTEDENNNDLMIKPEVNVSILLKTENCNESLIKVIGNYTDVFRECQMSFEYTDENSFCNASAYCIPCHACEGGLTNFIIRIHPLAWAMLCSIFIFL